MGGGLFLSLLTEAEWSGMDCVIAEIRDGQCLSPMWDL